MFFAREEIAFPLDLAKALAPARPTEAAKNLSALWEKLARRRGQVAEGEKHYSFSRAEAEAYAAYYLPANALKTALVLEEAHLLGMDLLGPNAHWLDCGTGPGTAYWGLAWWGRERGQKFRFTGWDQSSLFHEIASRLTARSPFPARADFLSGPKEDALSLTRRLAPTHLSFVNSLAEIYPDPAKRREACEKLLRVLGSLSAKDGKARYLLIIEPGSRESSRELAALKDSVGVPALLPCLDARPCGALVNPKDWCHEEVACRFPEWLNELGASAGLRKESILFSYALFGLGPAATAPAGAWRIVSQRLERKGQTECWFCTPEGKKFARAQRSRASEAGVALEEAGRGDLWQAVELQEKGDLENGARVVPKEESIFRET